LPGSLTGFRILIIKMVELNTPRNSDHPREERDPEMPEKPEYNISTNEDNGTIENDGNNPPHYP